MRKLSLIILLISSTAQLSGQLFNDWRTSGITTVQGTIINYKKYYKEYNKVEIQVPDWTNARRRTYFSEIDTNGKFSFSFFLFTTQEVLFIYKNNWPGIILSPNDTLKMLINADTFPDGIEYQGKTAIASKTINIFSDSLPKIFKESNSRFNQKLKDSLSFVVYKCWRDSVYNLEIQRMQSFIQKIQPENFLIQWLNSFVQLKYYRDFLTILHRIDTRTSEEKLEEFYAKIHSVNIDTLKYDMRISSSYSPIVNSLYSNIFQIAVIYQAKDRIALRPANQNEKALPKKKPPVDRTPMNKKLFFSYVTKASELITNVQLRESVLAHYYSNVLEGENIDLGLDSTLMLISDSDIKTSLINTYNSHQWRKSSQNRLKANLEKSTILDSLKNKYKGYVLYIDIWGTWCGPCYESFKHIPVIKKALKDEKVAFIYLCCHCDKQKWEQDIKEYNLDGDHILLTSEQFQTLSQEFNIIGVPRYIIIDKNGKIVDDNATRPWPTRPMQKKLIDELSKYL